ncbi:M23 family metallopeptidase [Streptomyces rectiverticillatus]|uniref:M23 family metallopeptidase n=1 Tax=Streptomyces rectiverticillatus TaxID=173860 RepID=UPI0015C383F7|nr:M23 family metallopeptidase [Streptomyces rectiverticillatus]QLE73560.1 M23 family metallopeptidase [Streptomyces rectiverticillatus]
MNDRHPAAGPGPSDPAQDGSYGQYASYGQQSAPHNYTGYDGYDSGQWETTGQWANTSQWGGVTGQTQVWDFSAYATGQADATGQTGQWDTSAGITTPATGQWDTSAMTPSAWGANGTYDTSGHWELTGRTGFTGQVQAPAPDQSAAQGWDTTGTGQFTSWDGSGQAADISGQWETGAGQWDTSGQWETGGAGQWEAGAGQTQIWDAGAFAAVAGTQGEPEHAPTLMTDLSAMASMDSVPAMDEADGHAADENAASPAGAVANAETQAMLFVPPARDEAGPDDALRDTPTPTRSSRRKAAPARTGYRPRRKALLTVAVPSAAVIGVAGIAAATVSGGQSDGKQPQAAAAPDSAAPAPSVANSKLDTQLASLSHGADDFATRANRTQERIDLKARQEAEKKRKAEEAARKEAERPKFSLPVAQHGLSAMYGQAGVNWMSVHTGIDFPVSYGTPVMAATDGTVRTQYNVAYGNMAIVTSPDGVETWYCHLSSTKLRSGQVKAGDVIAYSGNSGNSTGPHLHFEVRPGGSAVDPLPWLRAHGYDPT